MVMDILLSILQLTMFPISITIAFIICFKAPFYLLSPSTFYKDLRRLINFSKITINKLSFGLLFKGDIKSYQENRKNEVLYNQSIVTLNDIIVLGDNTIRRKYELFDVNQSTMHQLDWQYPIIQGYTVKSAPFTSKLGKGDVALCERNINEYYDEVKSIDGSFDRLRGNDNELLIVDGISAKDFDKFIKFTITDHQQRYNKLNEEERVIVDSCLAPALSEEEMYKISQTIQQIKQHELMIKEQRHTEKLYQKYQSANQQPASFESIESLQSKSKELNDELNHYMNQLESYKNMKVGD